MILTKYQKYMSTKLILLLKWNRSLEKYRNYFAYKTFSHYLRFEQDQEMV